MSPGYPVSSPEWPCLPLYLDRGEHVAICTICRYAISTEGSQGSIHLRKKHSIPLRQRQGLDQYLHQHDFKSGSLARPRPNGSPRHPALTTLPGFPCRQCPFLSASLDIMGRHVMKMHVLERPSPRPNIELLYATVSLQTWTRSTATQSYWVIFSDRGDGQGAFHRSFLSESPANTNITFVHDLRQWERRFQTIDRQRNDLTCTGTDIYEGTPPWLERTGWKRMYQGIPRDILKRMMLLPSVSSANQGLKLGFHQGDELISPPTDGDRIYRLVAAVDMVLDRCEETMQHTGQPILAWLKSHIAAEASPRPFSFLGIQQSKSRYRRTWKQFVTFVLRAFRFGPLACQELLRLKFPPQQVRVLEQIWTNSLETVAGCLLSQQLCTESTPCPKAKSNRNDGNFSREAYSDDSVDELSVSESDEDEENTSLITFPPYNSNHRRLSLAQIV